MVRNTAPRLEVTLMPEKLYMSMAPIWASTSTSSAGVLSSSNESSVFSCQPPNHAPPNAPRQPRGSNHASPIIRDSLKRFSGQTDTMRAVASKQ
eukprot:9475311-Pyramimonas_sp.AAC.1